MKSSTLAILLMGLIITACGNNSSDGSVTIDAASVANGPDSDASAMPRDTSDLINPADTASTPIERQEDKPALNLKLTSVDDVKNFMASSPHADAYSKGILPKIADDNLDYAIKLLENPHDYFIVVDKPSMYVVLYDKYGREQQAYKMACSKRYGTKHKRRDNRTPEGFFSAEGIYDSTDWLYTDDDGKTHPQKGQFGPRFIRLKTDVTRQIGIHGTCAPWALGSRPSHGCIRIHNDNIMELIKYVEVGTPIIVNPSERDQKVNREEGYTIPSINIGKAKPAAKSSKPKEEKKADTAVKKEETKELKASEPAPEPEKTVEPTTVEADPDLLD